MNFATLKGLTIPEGVVTQITDASGRVLWSAKPAFDLYEDRAVLSVAKITADTYAGETTYTGENFLAINVYPQRGGTVNVTFGGLTKTLVDDGTKESPNAKTIYFGTLYGVSDNVATPASGVLTIEGNFVAYAVGTYTYYNNSKSTTGYCGCITGISEFGEYVTTIPSYAFRDCTNLALTTLPSGITSIGSYAFHGCTNLALTTLPSGITSIATNTFYGCTGITSIIIPANVVTIGTWAFAKCTNMATATFEITVGWWLGAYDATEGTAIDVSDPAKNASNLKGTTMTDTWHRS